MGAETDVIAAAAMFFAGLILLIPHRIGMSRVNYVIKRYNLPISRAGLLLYKYHNNIELSLLCGTLPMVVIICLIANYTGNPGQENNKIPVRCCMIFFLFFMLISSIIMFNIYVSGGDFSHLNSFYFTLIFLTIVDGFANAFAFALNAKFSSMLSAGIPLSGLLVTLLHYIYKFFSDSFHWDDFDYYVLRLQLLCNIIIILLCLILWSKFEVSSIAPPTLHLKPLFTTSPEYTASSDKVDAHIYDWVPICLLAISLGTVYAFYPSIAPYSIIDFQYASIIELWILIISALLPIVIAILDFCHIGPSGYVDNVTTTGTVTFTAQTQITFSSTELQIKHRAPTASGNEIKHPETSGSACAKTASDGSSGDPSATWHDYDTSTVTYTINAGDKYWDKEANKALPIPTSGSSKITLYNVYFSWFQKTIILTPKTGASHNALDWGDSTANVKADEYSNNIYWNLVWICAIFYILCIQIFMSLLHYPDCLLSCFFNHPLLIGFISVLFNTLREIMQACGFAGPGKQCTNLNSPNSLNSITSAAQTLTFNPIDVVIKKDATSTPATATEKVILTKVHNQIKGGTSTGTATNRFDDNDIKATVILPTAGYTASYSKIDPQNIVNGTIAATNKLITLFVMMFCVFTIAVNDDVIDLIPPLKPKRNQ